MYYNVTLFKTIAWGIIDQSLGSWKHPKFLSLHYVWTSITDQCCMCVESVKMVIWRSPTQGEDLHIKCFCKAVHINANPPMVTRSKYRDCRMKSIKFEWNFWICLTFTAITISASWYFEKSLYGYIMRLLCQFKHYIVLSILSEMLFTISRCRRYNKNVTTA